MRTLDCSNAGGGRREGERGCCLFSTALVVPRDSWGSIDGKNDSTSTGAGSNEWTQKHKEFRKLGAEATEDLGVEAS